MDRYRHEYKYLISDAQAAMIRCQLDGIMDLDPNVGVNGNYNIRSLYFDDIFNSCFWDNENGVDPREKYRIRLYNGELNRISLECKRKERAKTLKKSALVSTEFVKANMDNDIEKIYDYFTCESDNALVGRFLIDVLQRGFKPKVIVEYDRIPYIYREGNVRVTFDYNLFSSEDTEEFLSGNYPKRAVMPIGMQLLEVKFDDFLPLAIKQVLSLVDLQQTAYSKYYLCRKYSLMK